MKYDRHELFEIILSAHICVTALVAPIMIAVAAYFLAQELGASFVTSLLSGILTYDLNVGMMLWHYRKSN